MGGTGTVLDEIIRGVREDIDDRIRAVSRAQIQRDAVSVPAARDAHQALVNGRNDPTGVRIIAEIKRASPSAGSLAEIPAVAELATRYQNGGAAVISVLTEQRRFRGSLADLDAVRAAVDVPVLRKDFTVDEYQIYEARAHGADLILLIVAALDDAQLKDFIDLTHELGMNALVETHTVDEIQRAYDIAPKIVGLNVRNLKTLEVNRTHYAELAQHLPEHVVRVAESGVTGPEHVADYARHGADAVLVGEALVKHGTPADAIRDFRATSVSGERTDS
ncbi:MULTISPECIES: indole-3-glycerol phosphate synthase TrpC [Auritidibacter]|uniref:indole-3-glycerol phosphate synthase TrpC n=1 Tax=Auritidibacter TaxID=1160973 RepID=UPI000D73F68F|nr:MULTISPECIES: indole-3-glycerol phosphate synthase TrpC [Auritidibacter]NIH70730.1 indole-3-glycerol phosphate synthase [Auritidibacter ignavus]PXA80364.1 indole-3-glycerol phosphate synthase TrpC [Auritidibacter sp. NML120636]WGH82044.1 indole-3-glycerol phosphate synthase TrpC [Auritidibacter ignavus]WGH91239.1 indole-3-glycerol phosphate synthase TrpC [Auritidibacter ignavus]WHS34912.1 indole-3-glycerol phosphate synthase TrpC [Auritidibacter ignavus]